MSERAAKLIFWVGTLSSLALFLGLTWDTHRSFAALTHADRLDANVIAGKRVFEKYNCNDCHTILGFGGYYAPDLTRVYKRLGEDAIRLRVSSPEKAFAGSYRKMPQQHVKPEEIERLVDFLRWVGNIDNNDWPPQDSDTRWKAATRRLVGGAAMSPGAALVAQENCLSCHALGDAGEHRGPRLEYISTRRDAEWIARYLADPEAVTPGALMPAFDKLSESQRRAIAEFISSLADRRTP
jgi:nitric oxide reductase subunit C